MLMLNHGSQHELVSIFFGVGAWENGCQYFNQQEKVILFEYQKL
ncbi:hypothetical protein [Acinetobacter ursingii]|nr:hypothetical protein [Acinetobacter ursingii]MDH2102707.1 hypothetical protein [Acinetobacter ursingii]MDI3236934.1 hypothetical protein [Acinetobacter ursingii]